MKQMKYQPLYGIYKTNNVIGDHMIKIGIEITAKSRSENHLT